MKQETWKSECDIPHVFPMLITKDMKKKHYRVIGVRNNCGHFITIKISDVDNRKVGHRELKVTIK